MIAHDARTTYWVKTLTPYLARDAFLGAQITGPKPRKLSANSIILRRHNAELRYLLRSCRAELGNEPADEAWSRAFTEARKPENAYDPSHEPLPQESGPRRREDAYQ
jgi:hypothetical protein